MIETIPMLEGLAYPSLIEETKLSQVLDKVHQIIAHPVRAVVLAELGEGELEEESETLHQAHPPGSHGLEVLQHEEPDLAGSLHQQELEARPGDDRGPALGLVSVHQPRVDQSPHLGSDTTKI